MGCRGESKKLLAERRVILQALPYRFGKRISDVAPIAVMTVHITGVSSMGIGAFFIHSML